MRSPHDPTRRDVAVAGHVGDVEVVRRGLRAGDPGVRATALTAMARLGRLTADDLRAGVSDQHPTVRRRAATVVGGWDDPAEGAALLRPLLDDSDDTVVEVACFAAGELAGEHSEHDAALAPLVDRLAEVAIRHDDSLCRESAVAALGALGDPRGRNAVLTACHDRAPVRRRAVLALAAFEGPEVDAELERLLGDRDIQVRHAAEDLIAISRGHSPDAP